MIIEYTTKTDGYSIVSDADWYQKYYDYVLIFSPTMMNFLDKNNVVTISIDGTVVSWEEL